MPAERDILLSNGTDRARREVDAGLQEKQDRIGARLAALQRNYERQREIFSLPDASLVDGIERWYSAAEAATFFSRTSAWIYDRIGKKKFRYKDGTLITPVMVGDGPKPRMRFNLDIIREIAMSMYRDGTVKINEMNVIMKRIAHAEFEEIAYDPDEEL
jgi:hypothetical protein